MRMRMTDTRTFEGGVEDGENMNRPLRTRTVTLILTLTLIVKPYRKVRS